MSEFICVKCGNKCEYRGLSGCNICDNEEEKDNKKIIKNTYRLKNE